RRGLHRQRRVPPERDRVQRAERVGPAVQRRARPQRRDPAEPRRQRRRAHALRRGAGLRPGPGVPGRRQRRSLRLPHRGPRRGHPEMGEHRGQDYRRTRPGQRQRPARGLVRPAAGGGHDHRRRPGGPPAALAERHEADRLHRPGSPVHQGLHGPVRRVDLRLALDRRGAIRQLHRVPDLAARHYCGWVNRLKDSTSPYLLQHADNPVDWWPWCDEAFAEAARRDVPVMLSVGYAACHWCHVMAHESFEDPETAAVLNEHVVAVKVDREERPDVDAVYMTATQAMTGQGGWPMTVFMTPDAEPFFTGTYYPRDYFRQLVLNISQAWRDQRDDVTGRAKHVAAALAENAAATAAALRGQHGELDATFRQAADVALQGLSQDYDAARGGFGAAPKFPPSMVLEFLLRHHERTGSAVLAPGGTTPPVALQLAEGTCEAMARGGMYDQLAGGFARYSVDAGWVVPHFEKMLYDNAQLARVYLHWWRLTGDPEGARIARETCDWMVASLRTEQGGFASSL